MNALNVDLAGKYVVLKADPEHVMFCQFGFGCRTFTTSTAVIGKMVHDGKELRVDGKTDLLRLATDPEIHAAELALRGG